MILKYLTNFDGVDRWNFVDGIKNASVYWDTANKCACVDITEHSGNNYVLAIHAEAYLLNDFGKTIEKVRA